MYVEYSELKRAIENQDEKFFNYYKTFGCLVVKGFFTKQEFKYYKKEYERQYRLRLDGYSVFEAIKNRLGPKENRKVGFRYIIKSLFSKRKGMNFLPAFAEESPILSQLIYKGKLREVFSYICGEDWVYLGSDGSRFNTTSFPWHRDWYTKSPLLKCNVYLNHNMFLGGNFLLIPGGGSPSDLFSRNIQKSISWPMQNKNPGGMNENDYLPDITNPRSKFSAFSSLFPQRKFDVPHVKVKIKPGDVVLFDQRLMHCAESNYPRAARQLLTFLVAPNADKDDRFDYPSCDKKEVFGELLDLIVNERNHIGIEPWGKELLKTDFVNTKHFINIEKTGDSDRWNSALVKDGDYSYSRSVDFNKYVEVAQKYKKMVGINTKDENDVLTQDFSYGDVHLGINALNVVEDVDDNME